MKVVTLIELSPSESVYRFKFTDEELDQDEATEWLESNAQGQYSMWPCLLKQNYTVGAGFTVEITGSSIATMFRIVFSN